MGLQFNITLVGKVHDIVVNEEKALNINHKHAVTRLLLLDAASFSSIKENVQHGVVPPPIQNFTQTQLFLVTTAVGEHL